MVFIPLKKSEILKSFLPEAKLDNANAAYLLFCSTSLSNCGISSSKIPF